MPRAARRDQPVIGLDQLPNGRQAEIVEIAPEAGQTAELNRLMEIGLIPGESVEMVKAAPLGDPLEIRLLDYSLVLRKSDAALILVAPR